MLRTSICPRCGSMFSQNSGKGRSRKYCRPDCGHVESVCKSCGDPFVGHPGKRYCGDPCRFKGMSERNRSDPAAQSERGRLGGRARTAQLTLSEGSYVKVDGKHEHRTVAERYLGRPLRIGEVVHHEDLNKHNNAPSNLIVFKNQAEHARHHKLEHPGKGPCECIGIRLKEVMPDEAP